LAILTIFWLNLLKMATLYRCFRLKSWPINMVQNAILHYSISTFWLWVPKFPTVLVEKVDFKFWPEMPYISGIAFYSNKLAIANIFYFLIFSVYKLFGVVCRPEHREPPDANTLCGYEYIFWPS
jgi:hypothetical protein